MRVISKQTLLFRVQGQKDYILRPSVHPVVAPDHIRNTHLFKLAVADGTVEEFIPAPVAPPVEDDAVKKAAEEKAAADKAAVEAKAKTDAEEKAQADADAVKAAEEKVAAEIEAAKAALAPKKAK